jgi:D-alanyl-D-alanine carboxypeptidase
LHLVGVGLGIALVTLAVVAWPAEAVGDQRPAERRLERALAKVVRGEGGPPGASAVLRRGGTERLIEVGVADVDTERPFTRGKLMRIASVSKAFSGAVALSLVDRGTLSLYDTIGEWLPSLPEAWDPVTLRQVLNHTGGLPSFTKDPEYLEYFGNHLHGEITMPELLEFVADEPLAFPHGTSYEYSNTDNIVVALMAEAATGEPYSQLLRELVLEPLRLHRTALPDGFVLPRPRINGYETEPLEDLTECCSMAFVAASGGLYSTPHELTRFTRGYVGGELFGGSTRAEQVAFIPGTGSEPPGPGRNSAGLALFRYETPCGTVFGHTGNFPGYTQFTASTRNGRRSLTVSANRQLAPDAPGAGAPEAFARLRRAYRVAVCALLGPRRFKGRVGIGDGRKSAVRGQGSLHRAARGRRQSPETSSAPNRKLVAARLRQPSSRR